MLPLKISSPFDRSPPSQAKVSAPARPRAAQPEGPKTQAAEPVVPERERRVLADRRLQNRRGKAQAILLDTRVASGRRRSPGRRAEDQQDRMVDQSISITA